MKMVMIKSKLESHGYGVLVLTLVFVLELIYLSNTTANVPVMDYWRYGSSFLQDIFNGGIRFDDFWQSINGQRAFLTYSLFYVNVKWFHWNTRLSMIFGACVTYVLGLIFVWVIDSYRFLDDKHRDIVMKQIVIGLISIILFNYVQWEIKVIEFYAPFSVVALFAIINFLWADKILQMKNVNPMNVIMFSVYLFIGICFVYSAFFPAVVGSILLCGAINLFTKYKTERMKYIGKYVIVGIGVVLAAILYMNGLQGVSGSENNFGTFLASIFNGELLQCMLVYMGGMVLHTSLIEKFGIHIAMIVGGFILVLYGIAMYLFFKKKKNKESYFSIMLILFSLIIGVLLAYGRGGVYGIEYMASSRYAFQSKLGLIGVIIILFEKSSFDRKKISSVVCQILKGLTVVGVICILLSAQVIEHRMSPYRRMYYENLIQQMYTLDQLPDEELANFQDQPANIRDAVEYMKKYHLGVFYYNRDEGSY